MTFTEEDLVSYVSRSNIPKEAMVQLNQLLFKELQEYCDVCEDDRMICVLSPQCPKRILLKVRIQSGAVVDDLPKFCYSQAVNNIKRYLNKNTTLYSPRDELIFNEDFINIMFPRLQKKILSNYKKDLKLVHELIDKSKIPAVHLDIRHSNHDVFYKIRTKDKLIREGTFIYDIIGEFLLIWYEEAIFLSNFKTGVTIINAKKDPIEDLKIIDIVFHTYCSELNIQGFTTLNSDKQMNIILKLPFADIHEANKSPEKGFFYSLIQFLQDYFFEITLSIDPQENFVLSLKYHNSSVTYRTFKYNNLTYEIIRQTVQMIDALRRNENN
ncbi:hypothetical protein NEF87_000115 [Candidatus Lokiarchaeum ossiferum]|uniref:Uncharacterized protein n=1 Tax=Candidatus Lokiarchaeum ossiferum TaxID=2951803 RepID=A0ABY6HJX2_9ARCH|nr:hypothetical protein NEF87_000115 [Candidatus Lokiarchaeum sp. B-35]